MDVGSYFDTHDLSKVSNDQNGCPIANCAAILETAPSQWGNLPYCPTHRIRIHQGSKTFVYYNGADASSKRDAVMRNIVFERDYFREHILGNAAKAETHRICNETSEDALTWNVFCRLARAKQLGSLSATLARSSISREPELYLWGLKIDLIEASAPSIFQSLESARRTFESGISKFLTEPDIMLYVPGEMLLLVEAKFTSGNTLAQASAAADVVGEKPKSREGILRRYSPRTLPAGALLAPPSDVPFYSQLYRNLVFSMHMAKELDVRWGLVSLVSEKQFQQRQRAPEFQNPTPFIESLLPASSRDQFLYYSWERLFVEHVAPVAELRDLVEYMCSKSANGEKALAI